MGNFVKILVCFMASLFLLTPSKAYAQGGVFGGGPQKIPSIQFERNNQYMADILSLQNQVSLLKKMIDRQKKLNDMQENLSAMGMPFIAPAPEYVICQQLPANEVCAEFYPDLYEGYISAAAAMPAPLPVPSFPKIDEIAITKNIGDLDRETFKKLEESDFMWAEINCLNDKCKAIVVPDIVGNLSRYTIRVGDKLPNGLIVEAISAQGVVTSQGSKTVPLNPAPSSDSSKQVIL